MQILVERLGTRATLKLFADADHSFHVSKRSGRSDAQIIDDLSEALAEWLGTRLGLDHTGDALASSGTPGIQ
jgi:hypothetical protein